MKFGTHEKPLSKRRSYSPILRVHSPRNANIASKISNSSIHNIPHLKQYSGSNRPIMNA